jgi:membrane fusion protein (multidrug efflux system)
VSIQLKQIKPLTIVIWSLLALVVAAIVVLAIVKPEKEELVATEAKPVLVQTVTITPTAIRESVWLPGRVVADVSAHLAAEKSGRVVACLVDKGDQVKKGDVLLRLDDRHWKAMQEQAKLEVADAKRELDRWRQMKASGAVADSAFDAVKQRYDLAVVAAEQAAIHVDQCTLNSPIDGVVDARMIDEGEFANEGQIVFKVLDLTPLKVELSVPERDAAIVSVGDEMTVNASSAGLGTFTARVSFVSQDASPDRFTYGVELTVDKPVEHLRPGMIVDVEIIRSVRDQAIAVPLESVIPRRGEHIVYVVEKGMAIRRVVGVTSLTGGQAVIERGLEPGEKLVVRGHRGLQDGVLVTENEE